MTIETWWARSGIAETVPCPLCLDGFLWTVRRLVIGGSTWGVEYVMGPCPMCGGSGEALVIPEEPGALV